MSRQPVVIYSAANTQQAHLLKGLLQQQGISAWVVNDAMQIAGGELPLGWTAAPRVVVAEQDALEGRRFAEEFDQQTAHDASADTEDAVALTEWAQWPVCPACAERRSARCSVCGVSGTNFGLADVQQSAVGEQVLLKCEACDDLFLPQWYRLCARCGHDFGDGIEVTQPAAARLELNARSVLVVGVLLGCLTAALAYVVWLFR
jgi:predicted RNA-binding Zn-ribbon protein involved in translation (DUF1610 family)